MNKTVINITIDLQAFLIGEQLLEVFKHNIIQEIDDGYVKQKSYYENILHAFTWSKTKQMGDFWQNVSDKYENQIGNNISYNEPEKPKARTKLTFGK